MSDFTTSISQQGFDTSNAPELNLLFSNKTNPLKTNQDILFGKWSYDVSTGGTYEWIVNNHNLGYKPVFLIYKITFEHHSTVPGDEFFPPTPIDSVDNNIERDTGAPFSVDETKLYYNVTFGTNPVNGATFNSSKATFFYMIFRQQVNSPVSYPVEAGGASEPVINPNQDFAIEMTRPGKTPQSAEADDFLFSSRYPTLSLCKIDSPGKNGTVNHSLGYIPFFLIFYERNISSRIYQVGNYSLASDPTDFASATASTTGVTISVGSTGTAGTITKSWVVVLRDYI